MQKSVNVGIWIIATGVIIALLYLGRAILAPFALAVFLFLVMEGFARSIGKRVPFLNMLAARLVSIAIVQSGFILFLALLAQGIAQFGAQAMDYETKINQLIADLYSYVQLQGVPQLADLASNDSVQPVFRAIVSGTQSLTGDLVLIVIYVVFLFLAASAWPSKLDRVFPEPERRERVRHIGDAARRGIETYLLAQTLISALITVLTYLTLIALGVDNALFLSALIFVLNYIPTVGSIIAAALPPLFALVQPSVAAWIPGDSPQDSYIFAALVFIGVSLWQFVIGNFVQPRIMSDTLNLSSLVVLLGLAVWGAIWGIPGMFLSAPLTVLMMILFAQAPSTRWIAILLSANGDPLIADGEADIDVTAIDEPVL